VYLGGGYPQVLGSRLVRDYIACSSVFLVDTYQALVKWIAVNYVSGMSPRDVLVYFPGAV
jgi:hypothetical protein